MSQSVEDDMNVLRAGAWALHRAVPSLRWLDLVGVVEEFATIMASQIDLTAEAASLLRFRHNFRNDARVNFPHPYQKLSTSRVLVEEFSGGIPVAKVAELGTCAVKKRSVADSAYRWAMYMQSALM